MILRIATYALGQLRDIRAFDSLSAALRDETDAWVRANAAWAPGCLNDARAVDLLIAALGDANMQVRANAAMALGRLRDARALEPLRVLLADPAPTVVQQARQAGHCAVGGSAIASASSKLHTRSLRLQNACTNGQPWTFQ